MIIFIDRKNNGAIWKDKHITIEMALCILDQYRILGYKVNTSDNTCYIITK